MIVKLLTEFSKHPTQKDGRNSICKSCKKEYDTINRDKQLLYHKEKRIREIDKFKEYDKYYKSNNKDKQNQYNRNRWKSNLPHKIRKILRIRIHEALNNNKYTKSIHNLIGCSVLEYKQHIEFQFLPEMTWENHGVVWEIDHIIPLSSLDLSKYENQKQGFHYSNTQPLFKTTDIAKSFGYDNYIGNRNKSNKVL